MPATHSSALTWYVVATKPRQERVAQANLDRQGYTTLLPSLQVKKRRRGKWQLVTEPTFPGYVFVALKLGLNAMAPIRSTQGCRDLVRFGEQPVAVPDEIIETLQSDVHAPLLPCDDPKEPFSPGDLLMIEEGPFKGLTAIYEMSKGADRVQVLITLLGSAQRIKISRDDVST